MPEWEAPPGSDFYFIASDEPEDVVGKILTVVKERIPRQFGLHPIRDIQVLCPMNRSATGARALNMSLQAALNPDAPGVEKFRLALRRGRQGDADARTTTTRRSSTATSASSSPSMPRIRNW